jgi:hypothetical protein
MKTTTNPVCRRVHCDSCEVLVVNGIICHEHGCPDAWRDSIRECKWCGSDFKPEDADQRFCEDSCADSYNS